jgi:Mce-associated membrane protein
MTPSTSGNTVETRNDANEVVDEIVKATGSDTPPTKDDAHAADQLAIDETGASEQTMETEDATADSAAGTAEEDAPAKAQRNLRWSRVLAFGVIPGVALLIAVAAGYLKWQDSSLRESNTARSESAQTARDSTIALLSYRPDTVGKQLGAARDLLTGQFRDSYTSLTNDVVIPGAKQQQISAVATVRAVASVSANPSHAVALVLVDQTVTVGNDAPTATASSVKVTMEKIGNRWLISGFDPV